MCCKYLVKNTQLKRMNVICPEQVVSAGLQNNYNFTGGRKKPLTQTIITAQLGRPHHTYTMLHS